MLFLFSTLATASSLQGIESRIAPVGSVNILKESPPTPTPTSSTTATTATMTSNVAQNAQDGKKIYDSKCFTCHATGVAGAPKSGSKTDWATRRNQGLAVLTEHAVNGYKAMPPKGACTECTTEQIQAAINYMLPQS